jgi:primosomal protein N' (replication factor Y)
MRVLTVAPLANGIPYEELSYFAKDEVNAGDLVEITVKRRVCRALVLEAHDAQEDRQSLRNASFNIKKISKVITKEFLDPKIWKAISYSASCLLRPIGNMMNDLLSEKSFELLTPILSPTESKGFELLLLEQNYEIRIARYKTTIRESFSKKKSLVMFFPTITDLEYARDELARGIDDYVISLHSSLTEKQYKEAQTQIKDNTHSLLILSTPSLIPWIRNDIGLVIIEREHSHYYYTHGETGYDMRFVIESLAHGSGVPCILGSHMLSLRAHMLYKQKNAHEVVPLQYRNDSAIQIIPMQDENKSASPYLSRQALALLHNAKIHERGHFFLYAHRKGMYPTTVCSDCGSLFTCIKCNRPYVLHKIAGVRTYVCHGCEHVVHLDEDTTLACRHCGGWRMSLLGISTGGVQQELERLKLPLFVIDGEHTTTKTKVKKAYKEWMEAPYGILIGTEMAQNVVRKCDGVVILSLDSLFSLPEYRTDEKILNLVTEMAEKIKIVNGAPQHKLILQTRLKNMPVLKQLVSPSFRDVYDTLLTEREQFLLPPYYTVIKASFTNLQDDMRARMGQELEPYTVEWFEQGRGITLLFIHIQETQWQNNQQIRERVKMVVADGQPLVNPLHFFI